MTQKQYRDQAYLIKLGSHFKCKREDKGWSQEYMVQLCEIDTRQLGRIERAETNSTISLIKKIADKLELSVSELLDF
ncbi:XRE family transcriptional regulator [Sphingobacterium psychroaquaticum]|uniref:helix-turn-helix domain-containing protein n=1 Tax=Sphingobacterium psychroaquaticum TaxID=561061 RepID=UPI00106DB945|nr:helix-turn-helix transcriptional regulator [Sphingobacterium psychroaquaticum]QBQ42875.1 XRE family transcriptional regulator [Sphingobacterium psychroaquaticum]